MSGTKTLINNTDSALSVTLIVRAGDDPSHTAGYQPVVLGPKSSQAVTYGSSGDPYLNGLMLVENVDGAHFAQQAVVMTRGSAFDDLLNTNSKVAISYSGSGFDISASN